MSITVTDDGKHITIKILKSQAECLGVVIEACTDTVGCIEASALGITSRQLSTAEDNMIALAEALQR